MTARQGPLDLVQWALSGAMFAASFWLVLNWIESPCGCAPCKAARADLTDRATVLQGKLEVLEDELDAASTSP